MGYRTGVLPPAGEFIDAGPLCTDPVAMPALPRRSLLLALGAVPVAGYAAVQPFPARAAAAPTWQPRWAPDPATTGLAAFETIEDDRANSHPAGQPHIFVEGDHYRFLMHKVDRDRMTDRQRN